MLLVLNHTNVFPCLLFTTLRKVWCKSSFVEMMKLLIFVSACFWKNVVAQVILYFIWTLVESADILSSVRLLTSYRAHHGRHELVHYRLTPTITSVIVDLLKRFATFFDIFVRWSFHRDHCRTSGSVKTTNVLLNV